MAVASGARSPARRKEIPCSSESDPAEKAKTSKIQQRTNMPPLGSYHPGVEPTFSWANREISVESHFPRDLSTLVAAVTLNAHVIRSTPACNGSDPARRCRFSSKRPWVPVRRKGKDERGFAGGLAPGRWVSHPVVLLDPAALTCSSLDCRLPLLVWGAGLGFSAILFLHPPGQGISHVGTVARPGILHMVLAKEERGWLGRFLGPLQFCSRPR